MKQFNGTVHKSKAKNKSDKWEIAGMICNFSCTNDSFHGTIIKNFPPDTCGPSRPVWAERSDSSLSSRCAQYMIKSMWTDEHSSLLMMASPFSASSRHLALMLGGFEELVIQECHFRPEAGSLMITNVTMIKEELGWRWATKELADVQKQPKQHSLLRPTNWILRRLSTELNSGCPLIVSYVSSLSANAGQAVLDFYIEQMEIEVSLSLKLPQNRNVWNIADLSLNLKTVC